MSWIRGKQKAWIDLSTYCNAACPQCHRTNPNGLEKADWLELIQWDLNQFKKAFPKQILNSILMFEICGTWGDPCMNKDIFKICKYIIKNSKATHITICTNGSMRDEDWWWYLGAMCGDRLNVVFTVDGINQEMHEKYRQKTDLNKILNHMEIIIQSGANAQGFTVVFKHNEKYIDEIAKMCNLRGATHTWISSNRWPDGNVFKYTDHNNNEQILEKSVDVYKTNRLIHAD